jgi:hypothetical protein
MKACEWCGGALDKSHDCYDPKTVKAKHSKRDTKGKLFVDCSECVRGGNGCATDKCSCGWKVKRGGKGGCFLGTLLSHLDA